ncbi:hypothetical protein [Salinisphaera sp.]|uniref:hypothetical protein n=1 Tax=Salinisphaera sp. TaxID=1914330 RepID=UPI002D7883A9|nr:hypothetical protein [Salinisphaera sp.]HET7312805.1 hypothetical protein [Salinisphaera sp.]
MWDFMVANAQALSVIASFGTMLIWLFYAHLLYQAFKRQRQARLLINQAWGQGVNSVAIVSNMSHEPVYIQCVMLSFCLHDGRKFRTAVTDFDDAEPWNGRNNPDDVTRQGPLGPASHMNFGTFRSLILRSAQHHGLTVHEADPMEDIGLRDFKITVICNYGPSGKTIGVQRAFLLYGQHNKKLKPTSLDNRRLESRMAQRKLKRWLSEEM